MHLTFTVALYQGFNVIFSLGILIPIGFAASEEVTPSKMVESSVTGSSLMRIDDASKSIGASAVGIRIKRVARPEFRDEPYYGPWQHAVVPPRTSSTGPPSTRRVWTRYPHLEMMTWSWERTSSTTTTTMTTMTSATPRSTQRRPPTTTTTRALPTTPTTPISAISTVTTTIATVTRKPSKTRSTTTSTGSAVRSTVGPTVRLTVGPATGLNIRRNTGPTTGNITKTTLNATKSTNSPKHGTATGPTTGHDIKRWTTREQVAKAARRGDENTAAPLAGSIAKLALAGQAMGSVSDLLTRLIAGPTTRNAQRASVERTSGPTTIDNATKPTTSNATGPTAELTTANATVRGTGHTTESTNESTTGPTMANTTGRTAGIDTESTGKGPTTSSNAASSTGSVKRSSVGAISGQMTVNAIGPSTEPTDGPADENAKRPSVGQVAGLTARPTSGYVNGATTEPTTKDGNRPTARPKTSNTTNSFAGNSIEAVVGQTVANSTRPSVRLTGTTDIGKAVLRSRQADQAKKLRPDPVNQSGYGDEISVKTVRRRLLELGWHRAKVVRDVLTLLYKENRVTWCQDCQQEMILQPEFLKK
ncbi:hypothetical protein BV898_08846 [Hypsibius exemplaris]|uniref:Uncharacterized protein n=1 Tax=Hypsibius exemplaris TaxID=2072580 RepID=A0A1W0WP70_HYPEX|nr:hypothetical protein BV898_08846 [Hypsibius exemplaris]